MKKRDRLASFAGFMRVFGRGGSYIRGLDREAGSIAVCESGTIAQGKQAQAFGFSFFESFAAETFLPVLVLFPIPYSLFPIPFSERN